MSTTTFCDLLLELTNVIKDTSTEVIRKIDELKNSVDTLSTVVKDAKLSSENTLSKVQQVENGMADMDLSAYTGAILELARNVNHVLHAMPAPDDSQSINNSSKSSNPPAINSAQLHKVVDKTRGVPGVLIITDMFLTSDHTNYVENQLELGMVTPVELG